MGGRNPTSSPWRPSVIEVTSTTFLVSRACTLPTPVTTLYTHVSPTATGNGIDPAATTEPGLAAGVAAGVALVVPVALEVAPAGLLDDAADEVPAAEPHPASANHSRAQENPARRGRSRGPENLARGCGCCQARVAAAPWRGGARVRAPAARVPVPGREG